MATNFVDGKCWIQTKEALFSLSSSSSAVTSDLMGEKVNQYVDLV